MPLARNERTERTRSIRNHLLNYQDQRGPATTPTGARQELFSAAKELIILIKLEIPGYDWDKSEITGDVSSSEGVT